MVASAEKVHPDFRSGHPVGIGNRSERRESYLLNRRKTSDGHQWSAASDGTLTVGQADGKWNAERSGKAIYRQQ